MAYSCNRTTTVGLKRDIFTLEDRNQPAHQPPYPGQRCISDLQNMDSRSLIPTRVSPHMQTGWMNWQLAQAFSSLTVRSRPGGCPKSIRAGTSCISLLGMHVFPGHTQQETAYKVWPDTGHLECSRHQQSKLCPSVDPRRKRGDNT